MRASQLLGAAEILREASGDPMTVDEHAEYEEEVGRLRGLLDASALDDAWARGRGLTAAEAVAVAVSD